jgi:hypothetical protein
MAGSLRVVVPGKERFGGTGVPGAFRAPIHLHSRYIAPRGRSILPGTTGITRGMPLCILFLVLFLVCLSGSGCLGMRGGMGASSSPTAITPPTIPAPATPASTGQVEAPPADPIVGTWYAPVPDDLTFEFRADGTFTERSPNFPAFQGTWTRPEENFYEAFILDRWGYRKPANLLYASGSLMTKGIGTMHRIA